MQRTKAGSEPASLGEMERAASLFSASVLLYRALSGQCRPVLLVPAGWLLLRGFTGQCALKSAGANLSSTDASRAIEITTALTINKTPAQVYAFWRELENLPLCMRHLQSVTRLDERTTEWTAAVFDGLAAIIWGAGAIGHAAALSTWLKGASRVVVIDRHDYRLALCGQDARAEILNYKRQDASEQLKEMTHGRGPDVCIDAVGMEVTSQGFQDLYDKGKQKVRLQNDRPAALRQAIMSCRKGGTLSIVGVYAGYADKFPIGPLGTKALTVKSGLVHGQKYIPALLEHIRKGERDAAYLKTQEWSTEQGADAYDLFGEHRDRCLRGVFRFSS